MKKIYVDETYAFDTSFLHPLVMSRSVPPGEGATADYLSGRIARLADYPANFALVKARSLFDKFDALEDYDDLFILASKPSCAKTWQKDRVFAEQRLSGVHPCWIRRLPDEQWLRQDLRASESEVDGTLRKLLGAEAAKGEVRDRLYVCDYRAATEGLPHGTWEGRRKYLPEATGLFVWRDTGHADRGELVPVAVRVGQRTVTPFDEPDEWQRAKLALQIVDGNVHETWSHLYGAHFAMEPVAVATGRFLPENHPVRRILAPHLRFLLFNNDLGKRKLVNPGGIVDQLLAPSLAGSLEIVKRAAAAFDFTAGSFPSDVLGRGMAEIPHYPYRDDGQLIWDAVGRYVSSCLARSYRGKAILDDDQLMRWWASLCAGGEAAVRGFPLPAYDLSKLAFILQRVIFTSSAYHAAVNYPQWEYMAYSPNQPLAAYADPGKECDVLDLLPPFKQAIKQFEAMDLLASYRHDRLGCYSEVDTARLSAYERARLLVFQADLDAAEKKVDARNALRRVPYPYLKPSLVPNSTSV